jgi:hypothetical protein
MEPCQHVWFFHIASGLVANDIKRFSHIIRVSLGKAFASVGKELGRPEVLAAFYPYSELKHTWKRDREGMFFKISDYLSDAPETVLESLSWYLLCRAVGRKCPQGKADRYLVYARSRELWESKKELYLSRSRNLSFEPRGNARDLRDVFDYVNSFYFASRLQDPILAWATESPRRRLGFYFQPLNLLAANRALDSDAVPRYVLEFVVFHELLHHVSAGNGRAARRVHHTLEFKKQEKTFSHYDDAERWLGMLARERSYNRT